MRPRPRAWSRSLALLAAVLIAAAPLVPTVATAAMRHTDDYRTTGDPLGGEKGRNEYPAGGGTYSEPPLSGLVAPESDPVPATAARSGFGWLLVILSWSAGSWTLLWPLLHREARS